MLYPIFNDTSTKSRTMTETFLGYNHNLRCNDGEFYDTKNLTTDYAPILSPRKKRGVIASLTNPLGILGKDHLAYIDGSDVYYNSVKIELGLSTLAADLPKQVISMGAYMLIFPDKKYINTVNLADYGSLECKFESTGTVTYSPSKIDGTEITGTTVSSTEPSSPANGALWVDTSQVTHALKQWSAASKMWVALSTTYIKIAATNIGKNFKVGDGVKIYDSSASAVSKIFSDTKNQGATIIYDRANDYIVISGLIDTVETQTTHIKVNREVPALDYVTECNNRIWGCHYGEVDGKPVNEIYACKLGDPFNWNCFAGISTDSYVVSLGSDGKFTGAITYLNYPLFFKEKCIHKIAGSQPSSFQMITTNCRGVQEGSSKSLAIVNEILLYKSPTDICAYDGSTPTTMSDALGKDKYYDAVSGGLGNKYYISMRDAYQNWSMFVFDITKGIWMKEDNTHALDFTKLGNELLYIDSSKKVISVDGVSGVLENNVNWSAETGIIGYESPDKKYISRFNFRVKMNLGDKIDIYIQYDSNGDWIRKGTIEGRGTNTYNIPIAPKRCDHMAIKIEGTGDCKIFSLAKIYEQGSDI